MRRRRVLPAPLLPFAQSVVANLHSGSVVMRMVRDRNIFLGVADIALASYAAWALHFSLAPLLEVSNVQNTASVIAAATFGASLLGPLVIFDPLKERNGLNFPSKKRRPDDLDHHDSEVWPQTS